MQVIVSRSDAKAAGLKRYFTGEPCHAGHVAERCTSDCRCVECGRLRARDPAERDRRKEYMAAHQRRYRAANPERIAATEAKRDKAALTAARCASRAAGCEKHKAILRKSYLKHKAKRNAEAKLWKLNNKEAWDSLQRVAKLNRRARENGAEGRITKDVIERLVTRQQGECVTCSDDITSHFEVDHILALSRGGSNCEDNLQLLCLPCNRSKGNKTMEEFSDYKLLGLKSILEEMKSYTVTSTVR